MSLKININFLEKYIADFVNDIEYKMITKKLKEYDLMAEVDDQSFIIFVLKFKCMVEIEKYNFYDVVNMRH